MNFLQILNLMIGLAAFPAVLASSFAGVTNQSLKADKFAHSVILDATAVRNLRIQTVTVEEQSFEETIFALGRIQVRPGFSAVLSSRAAGRALQVNARPDHDVEAGDPLVIIESRQTGHPPPQITLTAPISGTVTEITVVPGEPVSLERSLLQIVNLDSVYGVARVPESLAAQLREGLAAIVRLPGWPGEEWPTRLEHIGAVADPVSGTLEAAFHIKNTDRKLRPGMRAEFSIVISRRDSVLSVPRAALQGEASNRFLFVADDELTNTFIKVPAEVGAINDRFAEITRGLFPGDKVVTEGAYSLAFAGKGTLSLKEALDAAHGHEHNADGSELTPQQRAATREAQAGASSKPALTPLTQFSLLANGVLLAVLILSSFRRRTHPETSA